MPLSSKDTKEELYLTTREKRGFLDRYCIKEVRNANIQYAICDT